MSSKVGFLGAAELGKFVLRSQVLSLYRKFFRTARNLPAQQKGKQKTVLAVTAACGSASLAPGSSNEADHNITDSCCLQQQMLHMNVFALLNKQHIVLSCQHSHASEQLLLIQSGSMIMVHS